MEGKAYRLVVPKIKPVHLVIISVKVVLAAGFFIMDFQKVYSRVRTVIGQEILPAPEQ